MGSMKVFLMTAATAAALWAQGTDFRLVRFAGDLPLTTDIQSPRDGTGRLFAVMQRGEIRVISGGVTRPFLNISSRTRANSECGLLGLAFPPDFGRKQYFYVNYTDPNCRTSIVARYRVPPGGEAANPDSEEVILRQAQPFANHNGGQIRFGPDGYLYISFGDGGSGGDPQNNGQSLATLLGKILRIDVESGSPPYQVPPDNPFVGRQGARGEIWAYGLRNPWRFSFDKATGDLWIGDVGQNRAEEVNFQPSWSRGGENYGWRRWEGLRCFEAGCSGAGVVAPVLEYTREQDDVSVTGGFVYRGTRWPALIGTYLYADYNSGRIWGIRVDSNGNISNRLLLASGRNISTFGEDEDGELFLADHGAGVIYRIESGSSAPIFSPNPVSNAASFDAGLTPGSLASVFAIGITNGPGVVEAPSLPLPESMAGVRVTVDGIDAPLLHVVNLNGREQINFQTPWEISGQTSVRVTVSKDNQTSSAVEVPVFEKQPGVFTSNGVDAIVVHVVNPALVSAERPLVAGQAAYFYMTGLGSVSNRPRTGAASPGNPAAETRESVSATIGGIPTPVTFAGLAPALAGVYQVGITVPPGTGSGRQDLIVTVGGVSSRVVSVLIQ